MSQIFVRSCAALLVLSGCHQKNALADQQQAMNVVTGDDHVDVAANSTCRMFSRAEAGSYIGDSVGAPENAAMGAGCAWSAGESGEVVVAIVPADNHEPPKNAAGFGKIGSPGREGFVVPDMGGWIAGAIVGDKAIRVTVIGKAASEQSALKLLTDAASRISSD